MFSIWLFPKNMGVYPPKSSHFKYDFGTINYKPSILGYPYFLGQHPYIIGGLFQIHLKKNKLKSKLDDFAQGVKINNI